MERLFEYINCGFFLLTPEPNSSFRLKQINSIAKSLFLARLKAEGVTGSWLNDWDNLESLGGKQIELCLPVSIATNIARYAQLSIESKQAISYEESAANLEVSIHLLITLNPVIETNGSILQVVGSCQDVTQQKQSEKAHLNSEATVHHLINEDTDGIIVVDREGIVRYVNPSAELLFNRKANELVGEIFGLPVVTGERTEVDIIRRGGEMASAELRVVEAKDAEEIAYIVASLRDITDRKRTEESLRLRERAIAASNNGIVITDATQPDHPVIYVNPGFEQITGYTAQETIGRNCRFLQGQDCDQSSLEKLRQALQEERECRVILSNYRKDGSHFWNELHIAPVRNEEGQLTNYIGIQTDITERINAEEALRESEERLRTVLTAVKEGITFSDEFGHFEVFNREMEEITGYTMNEANACHDFSILLYPDVETRHLVGERLQQLKMYGSTTDSEMVIHTKFGVRKNVLISTSIVPYKGRQMFLSAYRDITERKRSEEKLRQQSDRERLISAIALRIRRSLDLPQILQVTVDEVRKFLQCDRVVIYRFQPNWSGSFVVESVIPGWMKVLGASVYDPCFAEEYVNRYRAGRIQVISDVENANLNPCHVNLITQFQVKANLVVPIIYSEKLWGLLIAHQCSHTRQWQEFEIDLLQQLADHAAIAIKQAELFQQIQDLNLDLEKQVAERTAQLQQSKQDLQEYINAMATFNSKIAVDGKILTSNKIAQHTSGLSSEQLLGMYFWEAPWWSYNPEVKERIRQAIELAATGQVVNYEEQAKIGEQHFIITNLGLVPVRNEAGVVKYLIAEAHDITDLKRAEEVLRKALEKEQELGELKSRFVSMASHEFRTPLATIQAASDLLKLYSHKMSEQKKLERLDKIQAEVRNMTELLEDVLTIGRVEAGKLQLNPTNINVEEFCRNIAEELILSFGHNHTYAFNSYGDHKVMYVDAKLLRQILTNLLSNAIKYSPKNELIKIELTCLPTQLILKVCDRGIGIPTTDRQRIFESFYRAQNVGNISGTGLGLAITKASVDLHGGTMDVESEVNVGTTFTVTLPNLQSS